MRRPLSALAALFLAVLVAGCASATSPAGPTTSTELAAPPIVAGVEPVALRIPAIGVSAPEIMDLGLDDRGFVEVPPVTEPERVGWYQPGVIPGDQGPAVLLGHVNGAAGGESLPGVFARLIDLKAGDRVDVDRSDGRTVVFQVTRVQLVPKAQFPTAEVYGDTAGPELRLITCGGDYDRDLRSYNDQVIAYAQEITP